MLREPDADGRYPLSGREYEALQMIMAALSCLAKVDELIPRIKEAVPYGYRDYKMIMKRLESLEEAIMMTIPIKKLIMIREELKFIRLKTFYGGILGKQDGGMAFVSADALLDLLDRMVGMECLLCEKKGKAVKHCPVRKIMTELMPYDVDPRADKPDGTCQNAGMTHLEKEK